MTRPFLLCLLGLLPGPLQAQPASDTFIRGVDISFTQQIEDLGGKYKLNGVETDALDIFKHNGVNYIRLRLWHTPTGGYCNLSKTLTYASRVKAKGFRLLLDIHYSDWWADPGKQNKPAAWASLSFTALKESVYAYTRDVIAALKNQGALPDMVQIGNEITAGMLWNDGRIGGSYDTTPQWVNFGELVKEGIRGAREAAADTSMRIMIHIDRGGDNTGARWFFGNLAAQGVQFDVIGLSYYPWWHGTLAQLRNNMNDLATRYGKDIIVAETAYPWTTQYLNDGMSNIGVDASALPGGYSKSVQGQKAFISTVAKIVRETTNSKGIGFFYWEPAYISVSPIGSSWEHLTTFDFNGNALSSMTSFMNVDTIPKINVTLRINTATNSDTLKPIGVVQVLGEILGVGSGLLPGGELLTWDSYSQVKPANLGGDYWEKTMTMFRGDSLVYKLWSGHSSTTPTYLRLGWEGPTTPYKGSRMFVAGDLDTTLAVQYYNSKGTTVDQYWTPVPSKPDSIGVFFRVNMAALTKADQFDPTVNGPVVVRGDSASSAGILSWSSSNVVLVRETSSVASGSFWSTACYFPKASIAGGALLSYKFHVENSSWGGWENKIGNRTFEFPQKDTTLAWKFFNERFTVTGVDGKEPEIPGDVHLLQNYPNPFNPVTSIRYRVGVVSGQSPAPRGAAGSVVSSHVRLAVYDLLGKEVAVLVNERKEPGEYEFTFDARNLAGGMYVCRLTAGGHVETRKMVLLR